jgi:hypothetical protein
MRQSNRNKWSKGESVGTLCRKRNKALDRIVELRQKSPPPDDNGKELFEAIDALALAHTALVYRFARSASTS